MEEDIKNTVRILREGGVILYPTDTIWGLGCDATNAQAVDRIYRIKNREDQKAMIILMDNENRIQQYIDKVPEVAWELLEASVDPITIVYPGAKNLAANLAANDGSVGIRIVRDEFCRKVIYKFGKPIVSTSANMSGLSAPKNFSEISYDIISKADYVVNWRQDDNSTSKPSSVIQLGLHGEIKILRS